MPELLMGEHDFYDQEYIHYLIRCGILNRDSVQNVLFNNRQKYNVSKLYDDE